VSAHRNHLSSLVLTSGTSTARAFGPAVIEGFTDYHWIYCKPKRLRGCLYCARLTTTTGLGPTLGALLATAFYVFLKHVHYWCVDLPDLLPCKDRRANFIAHMLIIHSHQAGQPEPGLYRSQGRTHARVLRPKREPRIDWILAPRSESKERRYRAPPRATWPTLFCS
jgi:hypothetical protein